MTSIYDWSMNASTNANSDALINWEEGQPPSTVNNSARAMMQRIREFISDICGDVNVSGEANAINVVGHVPINKYQDGIRLCFCAAKTNSKATTLNYNNIGPKPIYKMAYHGVSLLIGGEIVAGGFYDVIYRSSLGGSSGGWLLCNPTAIKTFPSGMIAAFAMPVPPAGWLECNGAILDRAQYAELFAAIGEIWGKGDGSKTFQIPDLRGKFLRGWDHGASVDEDKGRSFGSYQSSANLSHKHSAICDETGAHYHDTHYTWNARGLGIQPGNYYCLQGFPDKTGIAGQHHHNILIQPQGGQESRPINHALLYAIKV